MDIHVILDPRLPSSEFVRLGLLAETHGIRAVWTSSLLGARDPFVNLAALAAASRTIEVGAIAVNPFDTHPAKIASAFLTLNEIAQGRARIIIGGGGEALEGLGIAPGRRVRAVRECVDILRLAASGKRFDYAGELFRVTALACNWVTQPVPPIHVGASAPQMLKMAGEIADAIMMSDMPAPLAREAIATARASATRAGRDAAALRFSDFTAWHVYADRDEAVREARQWLAFRGMFRRWVCTTFMSDADYDLLESRKADLYRWAITGVPAKDIPERLLDTLVDNLTIMGHVSEVDRAIAKLQAMRDAGLTEVALRLYQDVEASLQLIGDEVIPAVM